MIESEQQSPVKEGRHHTYVGTSIPWWVRLAWIAFWIFAVAYTIRYFLPALQRELVVPP